MTEGFAARLNAEYFGGRLTPAILRHLGSLERAGREPQAFAARMCRQMRDRAIPAEDFSGFLAWSAATFVPRLLPAAWNGAILPITTPGRHRQLDEYLAHNPWHPVGLGDRILDLGCGFPPVTTVELARRFPEASVTGVDPTPGRYLVRLPNGDQACFTARLRVLYFQPGSNSPKRWHAMYADPPATRDRFLASLRAVLPALPRDPGVAGRATRGGAVAIQNPGLEDAPGNLVFRQAGIGSRISDRYDVIRVMNVLPYFDRVARDEARRWLHARLAEGGLLIAGVDGPETRHARYLVEQREGRRVVARELAFSLDQIRPLEVTAFFALHDDDPDIRIFSELIKTLRNDRSFQRPFDLRMDALQAREGFCARGTNGYLGGSPGGRGATRRLADASARIDRTLAREGFAELAARGLRRHGYVAWVNCVGHVAVEPPRPTRPGRPRSPARERPGREMESRRRI